MHRATKESGSLLKVRMEAWRKAEAVALGHGSRHVGLTIQAFSWKFAIAPVLYRVSTLEGITLPHKLRDLQTSIKSTS